MPRVPPSPDVVHDLEVLIQARHPIIWLTTDDDARAHAVVTLLAERHGLPHYVYRPHAGLCLNGLSEPLASTKSPAECLAHIASHGDRSLFELGDIGLFVADPLVAAKLEEIHRVLFRHEGAVVFRGTEAELRPALAHRITHLPLSPASREEYYAWVKALLDDMRSRHRVDVELSSEQGEELLRNLAGRTMYEVKKILTRHVVESGRLDGRTLEAIRQAKREAVERSGVLEYFPSDTSLEDIAGLDALKAWLRRRKAAFHQPERARDFGLSPPRGILLLGVQGCGKSLSAKAVAREWGLPLLRLDPSNLYDKYLGGSEARLKRAIATAEALAPVVLWIDEIEKAFHQSDNDQDGGTSARVLGSFLSWLQEKKQAVFVIATANQIDRLPPELVRKGRFDEIFFVDLPDAETRADILRLHLTARKRDPAAFDIGELAAAADGFSGAEIEQAVISALYTVFADGRDLDHAALLDEIRHTRPLSITMAEHIERSRAWAAGRAVVAS